MATKSVTDRFWAKVDKTEACWTWTGCRNHSGYGLFHVTGTLRQTASRVAYELTSGPIPVGMYVCHRCDNPSCVRPDHLFVGSPRDNVRDAMAKGRHSRPPTKKARGEKQGAVKLTDGAVRQIRESYKNREAGLAALGRAHGVSTTAVWSLVHRHTWRHVI